MPRENDFTCAIIGSAGGLKCWGINFYGMLGNGNGGASISTSTPVNVVGLGGAVQAAAVSAGQWHTCVRTQTGGLKRWGQNCLGQLGDGTMTNRFTPVDELGFGGAPIAAPTALPQSSPTVTVHDAQAVTSIVTIPAHEDARPHTAPAEAADQAIASLIGSEPGRRFGRVRRLDLDAGLLADTARLV